jgi:hypothetical protein
MDLLYLCCVTTSRLQDFVSRLTLKLGEESKMGKGNGNKEKTHPRLQLRCAPLKVASWWRKDQKVLGGGE